MSITARKTTLQSNDYYHLKAAMKVKRLPVFVSGRLLIPSPAEIITIKNLHLSTHNKWKFIINIDTLAGIAHIYYSTP